MFAFTALFRVSSTEGEAATYPDANRVMAALFERLLDVHTSGTVKKKKIVSVFIFNYFVPRSLVINYHLDGI